MDNRTEPARPATTPEILDAAADWVLEHGWTRDGTAVHRMGHTVYSGTAAILQVATGSPTTFRSVPDPWSSRAEAAKKAAFDAIQACDDHIGDLADWEFNDAESDAEVVELLQHVAQMARECAEQDAAERAAGLAVAS
jgi:hypothetical protein